MPALIAAGALAPPQALALWDDKLELFATQAVVRDDNLFRRPESEAITENYRVTSLGFDLNAQLGRQRLLGGLTVNSVRYDRFEQLDLDGHEGRALWQWRVGGDTKGELGFLHRRALASFANVQPGVQPTDPNELTTRQAFASGEILLAQRWRLALEAARFEQLNDADDRRVNDLELDRGEASFGYVSGAGNRLGLRGRLARGTLPNAQDILGMAIDNSYRQREAGVVGEWSPGGHSRLRAHVSRVRREYEDLPERNFDGNTWELALDWTPTAKLGITTLAQREISTTEEINLSFVLAERILLQANYRPSTRTELAAVIETSDRRFLGDASRVGAPPFSERLRAAGLQASYRPLPRFTLSLQLRREMRDSDLAVADYAVNFVSLAARIGF
ncbi:MAG: XrtB/PEP-CTERM-associated polysaccharide biosynthesis outer membrane protein EpsL [Burkholderiales bacterium]